MVEEEPFFFFSALSLCFSPVEMCAAAGQCLEAAAGRHLEAAASQGRLAAAAGQRLEAVNYLNTD